VIDTLVELPAMLQHREEIYINQLRIETSLNGTFQYSWMSSMYITYVSYIGTKLSEPDRFSINRVRSLTETPLQATSYVRILSNLWKV